MAAAQTGARRGSHGRAGRPDPGAGPPAHGAGGRGELHPGRFPGAGTRRHTGAGTGGPQGGRGGLRHGAQPVRHRFLGRRADCAPGRAGSRVRRSASQARGRPGLQGVPRQRLQPAREAVQGAVPDGQADEAQGLRDSRPKPSWRGSASRAADPTTPGWPLRSMCGSWTRSAGVPRAGRHAPALVRIVADCAMPTWHPSFLSTTGRGRSSWGPQTSMSDGAPVGRSSPASRDAASHSGPGLRRVLVGRRDRVHEMSLPTRSPATAAPGPGCRSWAGRC